jgi:capsular exopolysaccharide synthesis family protein
VVSRLIPAKYTADATVWIATRDRDQSERNSGPIRPGEFLESRQWPELLTSYVVIDSVVFLQRLYLRTPKGTSPDLFDGFQFADKYIYGNFSLKTSEDGRTYQLFRSADRAARFPGLSFLSKGGMLVENGAVGDSIGRSLGWRWLPGQVVLGKGRTHSFNVLTPREASRDLLDRLTVRVEGQQFLRVGLTDQVAERAAATLNSLTKQLVSVATALKKLKLVEQRDVLKQQTDFASQRLREKEIELQSFRIRTVTLPNLSTPVAPGLMMTQPTVMSEFFSKKRQVDELRRDRQSILDLLARSERGELTVDAFRTIPSVKDAPDLNRALEELSVAEAELRAARVRYTDSMKAVQMVIGRITTLRTEVIPSLAKALADQIDRWTRDLDQRIATESGELAKIPERSTTEQRLMREYEAADALFKTLRSRYEAAVMAEASEIPDLRILDPAVPPRRPSGLAMPLIVAAGMLAGIGLVAALFVVRDFLDRRIQYPEQVSGGSIGLTILGVVPDARQTGRVAAREVTLQVVEAFREIRMNVVHSFADSGPIAVTITSPSPQDGKSFVSANLAMSFAEGGFRTLLIDGDTRRGTLHTSFQLERRPGLIDLLLGRASLEEVLRRTNHANLTVIPSGERRSQSPELLGSAAMQQLLASVRSRYDVVIIDSPPFTAGVDAYVLGAVTGSVITVMRSGRTDRGLAEAKLQILDRLPIRPLGAVLNAVAQGSMGYGYYRYVYGYTTEDEEAGPERIAAPPAEDPAEEPARK